MSRSSQMCESIDPALIHTLHTANTLTASCPHMHTTHTYRVANRPSPCMPPLAPFSTVLSPPRSVPSHLHRTPLSLLVPISAPPPTSIPARLTFSTPISFHHLRLTAPTEPSLSHSTFSASPRPLGRAHSPTHSLSKRVELHHLRFALHLLVSLLSLLRCQTSTWCCAWEMVLATQFLTFRCMLRCQVFVWCCAVGDGREKQAMERLYRPSGHLDCWRARRTTRHPRGIPAVRSNFDCTSLWLCLCLVLHA
jgi:hypothetical protein